MKSMLRYDQIGQQLGIMSLSNSAVELNNLLNVPQSTQNKQSQNNTMNDSRQMSISQIFNNDNKNQTQLNATQTKGKFILAKRLSEHTIQGSSNNNIPVLNIEKEMRSISHSQKSNINIPPFHTIQRNTSEYFLKSKLINEEMERIKKDNIFNLKQNSLNSQYVEYNNGPRFRDGKVVNYTVVGSPQLYGMNSNQKDQPPIGMRQPRKKNTIKLNEGGGYNTTSSFARGNSMSQINMNENFSESRSNLNFQPKSSFKKSSAHGMTPTGMSNANKKKQRNTDFDEVTKGDLINEMKKTHQRIKDQEEQQKIKEDNMNIDQRHLLNRERRILEKYNQTVTRWVNEMQDLAVQNNRKPEDSLMLKSDEYRKKIEIINAFDSLRSDEKRFGQRIWYMMLRKNNIKSDNRLINPNELLKNVENDQDVYLSASNIRKFVNQKQQSNLNRLKDPQIFDSREQTQSDIFSNFMTVTVNNPYKPIEVVRKSLGQRKNLNQTNHQFNSTQSTYYMNTQSFLQNKIQENMHLLKNRIVMPSDDDINELIFNIFNINFFELKKLDSYNLINQQFFYTNIKVEGKNMYKLEIDQLLNDGNPNSFKYEKLNILKAAAHQINNNNNGDVSQKAQDNINPNRDSTLQTLQELDDEQVYEKQYDINELSKTGRHFFKDI